MIERLKFFLKDLCFCLLAKGKFIVFTMHSQWSEELYKFLIEYVIFLMKHRVLLVMSVSMKINKSAGRKKQEEKEYGYRLKSCTHATLFPFPTFSLI